MQPTHDTTFAGNDLSALEAEAVEQGVTVDDLVTELISAEIQRRYLIPKLSAAPVVPFPKRRNLPNTFA